MRVRMTGAKKCTNKEIRDKNWQGPSYNMFRVSLKIFSDAINFKSTLAGLDRGYLKVTIFAGTSAADWPKNAKFCTRYVPANNCHLKVIFPPTITCICIQYLSTNIQFSTHVSLTLYWICRTKRKSMSHQFLLVLGRRNDWEDQKLLINCLKVC